MYTNTSQMNQNKEIDLALFYQFLQNSQNVNSQFPQNNNTGKESHPPILQPNFQPFEFNFNSFSQSVNYIHEINRIMNQCNDDILQNCQFLNNMISTTDKTSFTGQRELNENNGIRCELDNLDDEIMISLGELDQFLIGNMDLKNFIREIKLMNNEVERVGELQISPVTSLLHKKTSRKESRLNFRKESQDEQKNVENSKGKYFG